jgi:hypothetical protein
LGVLKANSASSATFAAASAMSMVSHGHDRGATGWA